MFRGVSAPIELIKNAMERLIKFKPIKTLKIPSVLPKIYSALLIGRTYITSEVSNFLSLLRKPEARNTAIMDCIIFRYLRFE